MAPKPKLSSTIFCIFFLLLRVTNTKNRLQAKSTPSTITGNDCPKLSLLLSDEGSNTNIANNFDRQINQTQTLIKSILITMDTDDCVHVILIANKKSHFKKIKTHVYKWHTKFTHRIHLEYVPLKYPQDRRWMRNIYRPGSTFGLFLPEILPYDAVIYTDTDVLFLQSIHDLWSEMSKFAPSTLASALIRIMHRPISIPVLHKTGLGAGVMLMNLTRMRERKWTENVITRTMPFLGQITFGFEDFVNVYFHNFPEEVYLHTCDWNYMFDRCKIPCDDSDEGIKEGISILHGNHCAFIDPKMEPLVHAVYKVFADTKLTSRFDLNDLISRLKAAIDLQKRASNTPCAKYEPFEYLVLERLRQQFRRVNFNSSRMNESCQFSNKTTCNFSEIFKINFSHLLKLLEKNAGCVF